MKTTILTLSLLASLGLGATMQSGTVPDDVGMAQNHSEIVGVYTGSSQNASGSPAAVSPLSAPPITTDAGLRTYVVMVGGLGGDDFQYMARYNNMGFLYLTLVQKIGVPANQIYCLIGTGATWDWMDASDSGVHYLPSAGISFDFDKDSKDDVNGGVTRKNLKGIIDKIADEISAGDHVLFLLADDVAVDEATKESKMVMYMDDWNSEKDIPLSASELVDWMAPLSDKGAGVSVVLSQKDADGFVDVLVKDGMTVASARIHGDASHVTYVHGDVEDAIYSSYSHNLPFKTDYDFFEEFVCKWISAINGYTPDGKKVNADYNADGVIAIFEAFRWARDNDEAYKSGLEHPQFVATPNHVGHIQSLAQPMYPDDLYLYTESGDVGLFYASHDTHFWASPDIWVRKFNDDAESCIIPYISYYEDEDDEYVYLKTRVHNRGWRPYTGGLSLQTFWKEESLEAQPNDWLGGVDIEGNIRGGMIGNVPISGYIAPLGSTVVTTRWKLPERKFSGVNVLAAIRGINGGSTSFDPKYHKGVARKSYTTIYKGTYSMNKGRSSSFKMYNNTSYVKRQSLKVRSHCGTDTSLGIGEFDLIVPCEVYEYWISNGACLTEVSPSYDSSYENQVVLAFDSPMSSITNIPVPPHTTLTLGATVNADYIEAGFKDHSLVDLMLLSETGEVIGGMEYELIKTQIINPVLPLGHGFLSSEISPNEVMLTAQTADGVKVVEWRDSNGNFLGDDDSVIVSPVPGNNRYTLISSYEDEMYEATAEVPLYSAIERIYNKGGKVYEVTFSRPTLEGTTVEAHGTMTGGIAKVHYVAVGELGSLLDLSGLPNDAYVVAMKVDGVVTDTSKIVIQ